MSNNYSEFYKSYTESLAAFAKAARAETKAGYADAMLSIQRAYEDGFKDAMAHAFILITGHEPDDERFETSCEDALCNGEDCNSNYCENIYDSEILPSFVCEVCKKQRAYLKGSGDCKVCESCCTCNAGEPYCHPY